MRQFGLIGYPLSHSFSQKYFAAKFEREGISDCSYELFPITEIGQLSSVLLPDYPHLRGLNVTIPYKQQVLPLLNSIEHLPKAMPVPACNCIKIAGGRLYGYNTDVLGFEISLNEHLQSNHNKALVLGTGGAAAAVVYVLQKLGIQYRQVSRKSSDETILTYNQLNEDLISEHLLIINATPLGTFPDIEGCPDIPFGGVGKSHFLYDLVYNPAETNFLRKGAEKGATIKNGADMLELQAEESWRIWNESW